MVRLEHTVEGKIGHFLCENDTPLPSVKEMLFEFVKYIGQIEDNVKAQQAAAAEEAAKAAPQSDEPTQAPCVNQE